MLHSAKLDHEITAPPNPRPSFCRYGIFFTPRPGTPLAAFGRSWLGADGNAPTRDAFSRASAPDAAHIAKHGNRPGRYNGLHVVFKAPFGLREGMGPDALRTRLADFAAGRKPIATGPLSLAHDGRYLVLRPVTDLPDADWLAAQCVAAFDSFAANPSEDERAERRLPHLSPYQRLLLESFGDSNVLSEFRFAITLAGPLQGAELERLTQALAPMLDGICRDGVVLDGLSLVGASARNAPLRLVSRHSFAQ